ncbi:MAG: NADH-quinone oxidoreductase subunit NuoN [Proteobacteria bacterium]|nr:NADH-quinone oxidoreductase subunit NuoN [Pseudomonadota bacterium]
MSDFLPGLARPEIFLACAGLFLLMFGVFGGEKSTRTVSWLAIASLLVATALIGTPEGGRGVGFSGLFVSDGYSSFAKALVFLATAASLLISLEFNEREGFARFEYPVLMVFAALGMAMMVSANDLISLYMGLELQSLSLYVLAAIRRDSIRATEAGLKYFVLGALSSGLLLYGASLIYGFSGTTNFDTLAATMIDQAGATPIGVIFGIVFVSAALAFKISAAPFHMWTPDVYEGAPTPVTAFFAAAPKVAAIALFARVLVGPFGPLVHDWQQIVVFIAIASMAIGAFAAIAQTNIKRLMAYSSIGHVGYALVGLAAGDEAGVLGVLVYMAIYLAMNLTAFAAILCMKRDGKMVESISDLSGLARTQPLVAAAMAISMFSMAGIPPLAGFFGKLYVFLAAVSAGLYSLAVIGVLASVVSAFYYLRIVKVMYFDAEGAGFDKRLAAGPAVVLGAGAVFTLLFFAWPAPLVGAAGVAAAALFGG